MVGEEAPDHNHARFLSALLLVSGCVLGWLMPLRAKINAHVPSNAFQLFAQLATLLLLALLISCAAIILQRAIGWIAARILGVKLPASADWLVGLPWAVVLMTAPRTESHYLQSTAITLCAYFLLCVLVLALSRRAELCAVTISVYRRLGAGRQLLCISAIFAAVVVFFWPVFRDGYTINPMGFQYVFWPFVAYTQGQVIDYNPVASDFSDSLFPYYYMIYNDLSHGQGYQLANRLSFNIDNNATLLSAHFFSIDFLFAILLGPAWGITVGVLLRFIVGALSLYLFLREFKLAPEACLLGALIFSFCIQSVINTWLPLLFNIPVLLYLTELIIRKRKLWLAPLLALAYFSTFTGGQVVWSIHIVLFHIAYSAFRLSIVKASWRERLWTMGLFIGGGLVGLGLLAFLLLPSIEHINFINLGYRKSNSANFHSYFWTIMILFPEISGPITAPFRWGGNVVEYSHYLGLFTIFTFILGATTRSWHTLFFTVATFAIYGVITNSFYMLDLVRNFPFFDNSSNTRLRFLWCITVAVVAAYGFDRWLGSRSKSAHYAVGMRRRTSILALTAVFSVPLLLSRFNIEPFNVIYGDPQVLESLWQQCALLSILALLLCSSSVGSLQPYHIIALLLVMLIDLTLNNSSYNKFLAAERTVPPMRSTDFLQAGLKNSDARIMPIERAFIANFNMPYKIPSIQPRGLFTDRQKLFYRLIDPGALTVHPSMYFYSWQNTNLDSQAIDMMNVRYLVVAPRQGDQQFNQTLTHKWQKVFQGELDIYRNRAPTASAYLIESAERVESPEAAMERLKQVNFRRVVIVEDPQIRVVGAPSFKTKKRLLMKSFSADHYNFETFTNYDGYLMLSRFYHPAWRAFVDGSPVPVYYANGALMTIELPSGKHNVRFEFEPRLYPLGRRITLVTLILLLLAGTGMIIPRIAALVRWQRLL